MCVENLMGVYDSMSLFLTDINDVFISSSDVDGFMIANWSKTVREGLF